MPLKDLDIIQYNASGNMLVSVATKNGEVKVKKLKLKNRIKKKFLYSSVTFYTNLLKDETYTKCLRMIVIFPQKI